MNIPLSIERGFIMKDTSNEKTLEQYADEAIKRDVVRMFNQLDDATKDVFISILRGMVAQEEKSST